MGKRALLGDVVQIAIDKGFAYAQLTHRNRLCGCLLRVLPGVHRSPLKDLGKKTRVKELYHTFVFEEDLHESPAVQIVGHEPIPKESRAFPLFRAGVKDPKTKQVKTWWLWDGAKEWPIGELREDQKLLPLRQIWNYKILINKINEGWRPADEV